MHINASLIGQMIVFAGLVWFTMKFVWPPLTQALFEREKKIADGLEAAERSIRELELAKHKSAELLRDAKIEAANIVEDANKRASNIVDEAKLKASGESKRLIDLAQMEIDQRKQKASQELRKHVGGIAIDVAEKILGQSIDQNKNAALLSNLIAELEQ